MSLAFTSSCDRVVTVNTKYSSVDAASRPPTTGRAWVACRLHELTYGALRQDILGSTVARKKRSDRSAGSRSSALKCHRFVRWDAAEASRRHYARRSAAPVRCLTTESHNGI